MERWVVLRLADGESARPHQRGRSIRRTEAARKKPRPAGPNTPRLVASTGDRHSECDTHNAAVGCSRRAGGVTKPGSGSGPRPAPGPYGFDPEALGAERCADSAVMEATRTAREANIVIMEASSAAMEASRTVLLNNIAAMEASNSILLNSRTTMEPVI